MKFLNEDVNNLFYKEFDSNSNKSYKNKLVEKKLDEEDKDELVGLQPDGTYYYVGGEVKDSDRENVKKVIVKDGVTSIGDYAFCWCTNLTSIDTPDSFESIGRRAFFQCERLTNITIPNSVIKIGYGAFYACDNLTITCEKYSYADEYAQEYDIPVKYIGANESLTESYDKYVYDGPVLSYGKIIADKEHVETMAISKKKAISNIKFQLKRNNNLVNTVNIEIDENKVRIK